MQVFNYNDFSIGSKVETLDGRGYPILPLCGTIEKHLNDGHAVIKSFSDGCHYSTVSHITRIAEVEQAEITTPVS